jgi:quercetin dioxygenase-like cupin family protein
MTMRSGLVALAPGTAVGKHSTSGNEELLVVLEGQGQFRITDGPVLPVVGGSALYCPPGTEHDVINTGEGTLRYVYVVARALP